MLFFMFRFFDEVFKYVHNFFFVKFFQILLIVLSFNIRLVKERVGNPFVYTRIIKEQAF